MKAGMAKKWRNFGKKISKILIVNISASEPSIKKIFTQFKEMGIPSFKKKFIIFRCSSWRENCCTKTVKKSKWRLPLSFFSNISQTSKAAISVIAVSTNRLSEKFCTKPTHNLIFRTPSEDFRKIKTPKIISLSRGRLVNSTFSIVITLMKSVLFYYVH